MANLFANPTVSPSKSLPLPRKRSTIGSEQLDYHLRLCSAAGYSRHKLGIVMLHPLQEVSLAPQQEPVQGRLRVAVNVKAVVVGPDLQTHQHHSNVESPVHLQVGGGGDEEAVRLEGVSKVGLQFYLIDVIYGS